MLMPARLRCLLFLSPRLMRARARCCRRAFIDAVCCRYDADDADVYFHGDAHAPLCRCLMLLRCCRDARSASMSISFAFAFIYFHTPLSSFRAAECFDARCYTAQRQIAAPSFMLPPSLPLFTIHFDARWRRARARCCRQRRAVRQRGRGKRQCGKGRGV